ncbi:hypothetical protein [Fibrobacter sp. UBA4309]|uniref:hypothetical protein n=1 Tax=Fibrobacter sp. UBA4309 TaxID=1946537 RepID=UPI0025C23D95|nr:hypothetical protein [Fibrobacter sp. UBA4309]
MRIAPWIVIALSPLVAWGTELLRPVEIPATRFQVLGTIELDDDIYSSDMTVSAEYAPFRAFSVYTDVAYRFLSYSYEYSTEGYIHNYCNLHVNGFNESYVGAKFFFLPNFGLNFNWRIPPGEGSQLNRFHRMNMEPFTILRVSRDLLVGTSLRYNSFIEDNHYKPGDEIGFKASFVWQLGWNDSLHTGWRLSEAFLYQVRFEESENRNLAKPYSKMKDKYRGMKIGFDASRYFNVFGLPLGIGLNYEIHKGTLFGFETGHRIGIYLQAWN